MAGGGAKGAPSDAALEELHATVAEHAEPDGTGDWTLMLSALDELIELRRLAGKALAAGGAAEQEQAMSGLAAALHHC